MKAINIQWDVDDEEDLKKLPEELAIPTGMDKEEISEYISNVTGFCHKGFELSKEKTFFDIKTGDFVVVDNFYNHDYEEHILKVEAIEFNKCDIDDINPHGMVCYGHDLTADGNDSEDYICLFTKDDFVRFYEFYDKELVNLIKELTSDDSLYINKADLVNRFVEIDCYYKSRPWNLLQILTNINMIFEEDLHDKIIEVDTPEGKITASNTCDPDFPGIIVDFESNDIIETITDPTIVMEFNNRENELNMYTWGDCGVEDYTHKETIKYKE